MAQDRVSSVDQYLRELGRTSEVEVAANSLDALLRRAQVSSSRRAPLPLLAIASEHVRERRIAENDPHTGLKGPRGLRRFLRDALSKCLPSATAPLVVHVELDPGDAVVDGAALLLELALALHENIAARDFIARTGPYQLSVVLCGAERRHAASITQRLLLVCQGVAERCASPATVRVRAEPTESAEAVGGH